MLWHAVRAREGGPPGFPTHTDPELEVWWSLTKQGTKPPRLSSHGGFQTLRGVWESAEGITAPPHAGGTAAGAVTLCLRAAQRSRQMRGATGVAARTEVRSTSESPGGDGSVSPKRAKRGHMFSDPNAAAGARKRPRAKGTRAIRD